VQKASDVHNVTDRVLSVPEIQDEAISICDSAIKHFCILIKQTRIMMSISIALAVASPLLVDTHAITTVSKSGLTRKVFKEGYLRWFFTTSTELVRLRGLKSLGSSFPQ
jgi:hypothetical protein